jgi:hypothetical protein
MPRVVPYPAAGGAHVEAIEVMSEYLMFFVAVRRQMLPGLVLHSLFEKTLQSLGEIWDDDDDGNKKTTGSSSSSSAPPAKAAQFRQDKLADMLLRKATKEEEWFKENHGRVLVRDAAVLAGALLNTGTRLQKRGQPRTKLLEFIFNVWVDKLLYAAVRCSAESHAKQLSRGGDLTTILWLILQHAGLFRIGEIKLKDMEPKEKKPEEKKNARGHGAFVAPNSSNALLAAWLVWGDTTADTNDIYT